MIEDIFDDIADRLDDFREWHPILSTIVGSAVVATLMGVVVIILSLLGNSALDGAISRIYGNPNSHDYFEQLPFEVKEANYSNGIASSTYYYLEITIDPDIASQQSLTSVDNFIEDICGILSIGVKHGEDTQRKDTSEAMVYIGDTGNGLLIHKDTSLIYGKISDNGLGIDNTSDNYTVFQYKEESNTWDGVSDNAGLVLSMLANAYTK